MVKITEYLQHGEENAQSGRDMARLLGVNLRDISIAIERERQAGSPICASTDALRGGYYLADNREEMEHYCSRLSRRVGEINRTLEACKKIMPTLPSKASPNE